MKKQALLDFGRDHRFFIGPLLVILVLGFYFDLKTRLDEFHEVTNQETELSLQLEEKEQALRQAGSLSSRLLSLRAGKIKKPLLDQLLEAAVSNHCSLTGLQTEFKNGESAPARPQATPLTASRLLIQMRLHSDYAGFYQFIETLLRQGLPLQLDRFSLKDQGERLEVQLQFSAFPWAYWLAAPSQWTPVLPRLFCCARDPFRDAPLPPPEQESSYLNSLDGPALKQLRYVGYVAQDGKSGALLLLPDGRGYDIYPGSRLGKEAWRVVSVDENKVVLGHPTQKQSLQIKREGR